MSVSCAYDITGKVAVGCKDTNTNIDSDYVNISEFLNEPSNFTRFHLDDYVDMNRKSSHIDDYVEMNSQCYCSSNTNNDNKDDDNYSYITPCTVEDGKSFDGRVEKCAHLLQQLPQHCRFCRARFVDPHVNYHNDCYLYSCYNDYNTIVEEPTIDTNLEKNTDDIDTKKRKIEIPNNLNEVVMLIDETAPKPKAVIVNATPTKRNESNILNWTSHVQAIIFISALIGAFLNSYGFSSAFLCWFVSNTVSIWYFYKIRQYILACEQLMFFVTTCIAIYNVYLLPWLTYLSDTSSDS
ncbi:049L [Phenacoccus solenopsis nudivirus]|nr:049L [Phenacoccus solenopsis nudivirus]